MGQGGIAERDVMEYRAESLRLDVGYPNHLGPLLGFLGDELANLGSRARKRRAAAPVCLGSPSRRERKTKAPL